MRKIKFRTWDNREGKWADMKNEYLSNRRSFCNLITDASHFKISGCWTGDAYREHRIGVYRNGVLFTNYWNTHDYCSIHVAENPRAELVLGCRNARAYGNPMPKPSEGKFVTVWRDGQWCLRGPWECLINELLFDIEWDIRLCRKREGAKMIREQFENNQKSQDATNKLRMAYA